MPKTIFNDDFLKPYLESFRLSAIPDIQHKKAILQNWHESIAEGKFTKEEEEAKSRFVNEIFGDVLGFNYKFQKVANQGRTQVCCRNEFLEAGYEVNVSFAPVIYYDG